jgi:hypothetical protein
MGYERTLLFIVLGIFIAVSGFLFFLLAMVIEGQGTRSATFLKISGIIAFTGVCIITFGIVNLRKIRTQKSKR